jgi:hypothetical protein
MPTRFVPGQSFATFFNRRAVGGCCFIAHAMITDCRDARHPSCAARAPFPFSISRKLFAHDRDELGRPAIPSSRRYCHGSLSLSLETGRIANRLRGEAHETRRPKRMTSTTVYFMIFRSIPTKEAGPEKRKARRDGRTSQVVR